MKVRVKNLGAFLLIFCAACGAEVEAPSLEASMPKPVARQDCPAISKIAAQMIKVSEETVRGREYCGGRIVAESAGTEIVVFTLEGICGDNKTSPIGSCGNTYSQYMTGASAGQGLTPIRVGGKTRFRVEAVEIQNGQIILSGLGYKKSDGSCCPTEKIKRAFEVDGQSLVEITP